MGKSTVKEPFSIAMCVDYFSIIVYRGVSTKRCLFQTGVPGFVMFVTEGTPSISEAGLALCLPHLVPWLERVADAGWSDFSGGTCKSEVEVAESL